MKIGIDIDGVLADFNTGYIDLIRRTTGIQLPPVSNVYPDVWHYERAAGVTKKQEHEVWEHIRNSEFWGQLFPLKGTLEVLDKLTQLRYEGHEIYFITSRVGKKVKFQTERWLSLYGMNNPTVLISDKKGPVAQGLELDVFIDDKPENCADVQLASPKTRVFLLDQPYNRKTVTGMQLTPSGMVSGPIYRALSVMEVLNDVLDEEPKVKVAA